MQSPGEMRSNRVGDVDWRKMRVVLLISVIPASASCTKDLVGSRRGHGLVRVAAGLQCAPH